MASVKFGCRMATSRTTKRRAIGEMLDSLDDEQRYDCEQLRGVIEHELFKLEYEEILC